MHKTSQRYAALTKAIHTDIKVIKIDGGLEFEITAKSL